MNRSWSIIANALDNVEWVQPFLEDRAIILCDGAYNHFEHGDLSQPVVIGDFDSIRTLDRASSQYVYVKDQNKTDGQKAIEYADRHGAQDILLLNVIGNDLGHTLHAIGLLKRFYNPCRPIKILHPFYDDSRPNQFQISTVQYFSNEQVHIAANESELISLFGFPQCSIQSSGLQWELDGMILRYPECNSSRNRFKNQTVSLHIKGDCLVVLNNKNLL